MQDLPEWLEDFTENPVDEGVSESRDTPASTSRESDQEPGKTRIGQVKYYHSLPEGPKLRSVQEDQKLHGLLAENALVTEYFEQKVLVKNVNLETFTDMPWWYKI